MTMAVDLGRKATKQTNKFSSVCAYFYRNLQKVRNFSPGKLGKRVKVGLIQRSGWSVRIVLISTVITSQYAYVIEGLFSPGKQCKRVKVGLIQRSGCRYMYCHNASVCIRHRRPVIKS